MSLFDEHRPCACRQCKPVTPPADHGPELSETWRAVREQRDAISTLLWGAGTVDDQAAGVALKGIVLELDTLSARLRSPQAPAPASVNESPTHGASRPTGDQSPRSSTSAATER